jgi:hypothetical protein
VCSALPPPDAVPIAGLAGLVNARAWYGLTATIARPAGQAVAGPPPAAELVLPGAHRVPAGPMALAAVLATVVALTRLVFVFGGPAATGHPQAAVAWETGTRGTAPASAAATGTGHDPVLEIAGFGSWCCGQDRALAKALPGTVVQQFSLLGTNRRGQPMPYGAKASNIPLPQLGDWIAAQVWRLHEETGRPWTSSRRARAASAWTRCSPATPAPRWGRWSCSARSSRRDSPATAAAPAAAC